VILKSRWTTMIAVAAGAAVGAAPVADAASGTSLHLKAPKEIKVGKNFTLKASGNVKGHKDVLNIYFQTSKCPATLADEVAQGKTPQFHSDVGPGKFSVKYKGNHGTIKQSARFCGYLYKPTASTTSKPEAKASRKIKFT
jgi:hypothetical protein